MSLKDRADALRQAQVIWRNPTNNIKKRVSVHFMGPDDPWDEDTQKIDIGVDLQKALEEERKSKFSYNPFPWLDPVCVCGGDKAKTTHSPYCAKFKKY